MSHIYIPTCILIYIRIFGNIYKATRSVSRPYFAMWQVSAGARMTERQTDLSTVASVSISAGEPRQLAAKQVANRASSQAMSSCCGHVDGAPRDKKRWSMAVVECRRALGVLTLYSGAGTWGGQMQNIIHTHTNTHAGNEDYDAHSTFCDLWVFIHLNCYCCQRTSVARNFIATSSWRCLLPFGCILITKSADVWAAVRC